MNAHTPGPWQIDHNNCHSGQVAVCHGDEEGYVEVWSENWSEGTSQSANARLIAAAPDLLAELQNIANANPLNWDAPHNDFATFHAWAQSRARAAIAKAVMS